MAKLLITGGAGYIGSHTVRHLIATGTPPNDIVVFDNLETGRASFLPPDVELVCGDLRNADEISALFGCHDFVSVLHFAAYSDVGESVRMPDKYFRNNILGGFNLLEAARRSSCRRFVFSSTCAVYGTPSKLPITEDFPAVPESPYGESKRCFEEMLAWYARAYGMRSICLRYFNAAGAGYGIGEWHESETKLIPLVLRVALDPGVALIVNGEDYPTPDGTCIRDYVHVLDLADAHLRALRFLERDADDHVRVNLGTGAGVSVREVIRIAQEISGREVPAVAGPRRPGDPLALFADATRARHVLGWTARRDIRTIIRDAWAWHLQLRNT